MRQRQRLHSFLARQKAPLSPQAWFPDGFLNTTFIPSVTQQTHIKSPLHTRILNIWLHRLLEAPAFWLRRRDTKDEYGTTLKKQEFGGKDSRVFLCVCVCFPLVLDTFLVKVKGGGNGRNHPAPQRVWSLKEPMVISERRECKARTVEGWLTASPWWRWVASTSGGLPKLPSPQAGNLGQLPATEGWRARSQPHLLQRGNGQMSAWVKDTGSHC